MFHGNDFTAPERAETHSPGQFAPLSFNYDGQMSYPAEMPYEEVKQEPERPLDPSEDGKQTPSYPVEAALDCKLSSLCIDDDAHEYEEHPAVLKATQAPPVQALEPRRHASEIPFFKSEWSRSPWRPKPALERDSAHSASTGVSSSLSLHNYTSPGIPQPPGLYPAAPQPSIPSAPYYHPSYSSTTLMQPVMAMQNAYAPMYQIPEYYAATLCQPVFVPVAVPYYQYAAPPKCQPPARGYSSFTKLPVQTMSTPRKGSPDPEEGTHPLVQKFEENGRDCKILAGHVAKLGKSQSGSRFLQKEVEKADPAFLSFVVHEVRFDR